MGLLQHFEMLKYLGLMVLIDLSWMAKFFTVNCDVEKTLYLLFKIFEQFYYESFRAE